MGFIRLFGVVGQVLVKPHLLRDVQSEFDAFNMEEASVRRKLAATKEASVIPIAYKNGNTFGTQMPVKVVIPQATTENTINIHNNSKLYNRVHLQEHKYEASVLRERLREIEADKSELGEESET